jgi:hypothetical protein
MRFLKRRNKALKPAAVKIDWKGYFHEFRLEHGEPVEHNGRLLFGDGWTYSNTDYAGPEWPPPEERAELLRMQQTYWTLRRGLLVQECTWLEQQIESLATIRSVKSTAVTVTRSSVEEQVDELGQRKRRLVRIQVPVEQFLADAQARLAQVRADQALCQAKLDKLREITDGSVQAV